MSQYRNQYGTQTRKTDEYGNPVNQVDQYGNPISGGGGLTGEAGRQHYGTTGGATDHGHGHGQQHHGVDQTTGYGTHTGGVGGYGTNPEYGSTNVGSGYGTGTGYGGTGTTEYVREEHYVQHGDKKGVMDKIKEKIPGTEQSRTNIGGTGHGTGTGTGYGTTGYGASGGGIGNTRQEYVREEHHVHHGDRQHGASGGGGLGSEEYVREERRVNHGDLKHGAIGGGIGSTGQEYVREEHHGDQKHGAMGGGIGNTGQQYVREERHGDQKHGASGGGIGNTTQEYVREERRGIGSTGEEEYVREEHRVKHGEKKGIMEKIKEKLPGSGH